MIGAYTFPVGEVTRRDPKLMDVTKASLYKGDGGGGCRQQDR